MLGVFAEHGIGETEAKEVGLAGLAGVSAGILSIEVDSLQVSPDVDR